MPLRRAFSASLLGFLSLAVFAQTAATDKYAWLEDPSGERSMTWVNAENAKTAKVLETGPDYTANYDAALRLASDPRRLATPSMQGGWAYNWWRDATNPRGLLRRTTIADYLTDNPHWTTDVDFDALGKAEHTGWVGRGLDCLYPGDRYCLVNLSAGGEDALTIREFDVQANQFVEGGFKLPRSKMAVAWVDKDTLLVARDWGEGTMTTSKYPFVIKEWRRGTPLESAKEVFRGATSDQLESSASVLHDAQGNSLQILNRGVTFFESQKFIRTAEGAKRLEIPGKAAVTGMIDGRVLVNLREAWTPAAGGKTFAAGSLVELKLAEILKDPAHLKPSVVFAPTAEEFLQAARVTRDRLLMSTLNHVQGRAYVLAPPMKAGASWTSTALPVPPNMSVGLISASVIDNKFFLSITGFLTPPSLWLGDALKATIVKAKSQPDLFDASNEIVDQMDATSKDGTKVPYFVVHPKGMKMDGSNATLLTAYGGFQLSQTPAYSAADGKLWLEKGGVYVLANIRGGGEFGPAWHEAGLKTKRQVIYDDFAAVAEDLIKRGITSPRRLGIEGASNGGLLMGVEFEQHPDLWHAVVIEVPLLDMLGYEHIAAGASWVGEYGSVSIPAERAWLEKLSPYNNLKPDGKYPEPLIWTTTKDDRVGPQHARKFAALMEEYRLPFYFHEVIEGGHGAGADLKQSSETTALSYTYLQRKLMN